MLFRSVITWRIPTDGTPTDVATTTNNVDIASNVARFFKWIVAFLLGAWVIGTVVLLGLVSARRGRRTPRT